MPLIAGMLSSIGPGCASTPHAPCSIALRYARAASLHAKGDGADRRAVHARERLGKAARLGVDDEVDVALPVEQHVLRAVPRDRDEAHCSNSRPSATGSGAAYSTNSNPSVPSGLSHSGWSVRLTGMAPACTRIRLRRLSMPLSRHVVTPANFSCASTSDATYLSPKPSRLALTRLWCTASPTIAGTGSDSAKCV